MSQPISGDLFAKNLLALFEETFEKVGGIYLDGGTSLLETLKTISADTASRPTRESGTTIAAHVIHARFYLQVLRDYMDGKWHETVDWKGSWSQSSVTENEWDILRQQLEDDYRGIIAYLKGIDNWDDERRLGGALAIAIHTAYHLGSIRQIMRAIAV